MKRNEPRSGFFRDDGTEINPELVRKPGLCILCRKDDDPKEDTLCILTRDDQRDDPEFECDAFDAKGG